MKIPAPHGHLEALLREPEEGSVPDGRSRPPGAALLCHPHPQHGGTMHTKAVFRAAQAMNEAGLRVLRFNFRGVGASTGEWSGGEGEAEDVRVALDLLAERSEGAPLVLGGFSFGTKVGLPIGLEDDRVRALLGLGMTVRLYDYAFLREVEKPLLVVQGGEDEFGPEEEIREAVREFGDRAELRVVRGADHFFTDREEELKDAVRAWFRGGAGAEALGRGVERGDALAAS